MNTRSQTTQADLLLTYLARCGVEYVFGIPGGAIEPLYDALARRKYAQGHPQAIVTRHEAGAAFMADGYARETGRLGVCCSTTGPGATNLISGVANAYTDNIPMLVITPQTPLPRFGRNGLQESSCDSINIPAMFANCTRYNSFVSHQDQLEGKLYAALMRAQQQPRGPAHLSIPMDILGAPLDDPAAHFSINTITHDPQIIDTGILENYCRNIVGAKRIVMLLGAGAYHAREAILEFAEIVNAHIVTTPEGKRCVGISHPLYRGVFGFGGHRLARETLLDEKVNLVLAIGTRLSELETGGWDNSALLNERLVHIEENTDNFLQSPMAKLHVHGNLNTIFSTLVPRAREAFKTCIIPRQNHHQQPPILERLLDNPGSCHSDAVPLKPQRLMCVLSDAFPDNTRFTIDTGNSWAWATHYLHLADCRNYHVAMSYGTMGWGIGAAIGMAFAKPDAPAVCITGDGSFLMHGNEITVAQEHGLKVIIIILNDHALGMIKHGQRMGGAEAIGFQLPQVDYSMVARAMGIVGINIQTPEDLDSLDIDALCQRNGPTLLNVYIDPDEVPPMGVRMKTLHSARKPTTADSATAPNA